MRDWWSTIRFHSNKSLFTVIYQHLHTFLLGWQVQLINPPLPLWWLKRFRQTLDNSSSPPPLDILYMHRDRFQLPFSAGFVGVAGIYSCNRATSWCDGGYPVNSIRRENFKLYRIHWSMQEISMGLPYRMNWYFLVNVGMSFGTYGENDESVYLCFVFYTLID